MHNLLHLLCRLPNGANIHNCRPSEVGTGKTLHGRRHGGREHDSLGEEMGGEGWRWEKKGSEERGVVGEGGGGGKEMEEGRGEGRTEGGKEEWRERMGGERGRGGVKVERGGEEGWRWREGERRGEGEEGEGGGG